MPEFPPKVHMLNIETIKQVIPVNQALVSRLKSADIITRWECSQFWFNLWKFCHVSKISRVYFGKKPHSNVWVHRIQNKKVFILPKLNIMKKIRKEKCWNSNIYRSNNASQKDQRSALKRTTENVMSHLKSKQSTANLTISQHERTTVKAKARTRRSRLPKREPSTRRQTGTRSRVKSG